MGVPPAPPPPPQLASPPKGSVLVLAPHPDDEALGCGGTLALHALRGDPILVVFLTDGAAGDPRGFYQGIDYVRLREEEAREAASFLGVNTLEFLRFPDGGLSQSGAVEEHLDVVIRRFRPDVVYAPSPVETHPDHWAAARALGRVLNNAFHQPAWWAYELWTPLMASHLIDIGSVWERKRRAILAYQSQLRYVDYLSCIEGLARYRTLNVPGLSLVEAYQVMAPESAVTLSDSSP